MQWAPKRLNPKKTDFVNCFVLLYSGAVVHTVLYAHFCVCLDCPAIGTIHGFGESITHNVHHSYLQRVVNPSIRLEQHR